MDTFLILKLQGPMQAWGVHTYEDYRPSNSFPTRSGVVGLLGACLGIDRNDRKAVSELSSGVRMAVRSDDCPDVTPTVLTDFHTVMDARKVGGKVNPNPVVSRREYLCDACFTVALGFHPESAWQLEQIKSALFQPIYTPFLGRRSCALARPLYECEMEADSLIDALDRVYPHKGVIYSEEAKVAHSRILLRDVPAGESQRQFSTRYVHIHSGDGGKGNVSQ
ncbi:MAG: type I-E CRISPR-associated protein Cas5/CasD [Candidatus Thiodiazotropha sp. (ex Lucinoma kastoroae)]|nr:type I-E CRISPR-associated protein Cas5/CasD [Candidatus Thiodiazotropha sp. (ex Lucinoma kastoroae)]